MSKQSAENYLDELLNSVNGTEKNIEMVEDDIFAADTEDRTESTNMTRNTAKAEAEFLMEFERELAGEDFEDFLRDFEENDIQPEDRLGNEDVEFTEEDVLLSMLGGVDESVDEIPLEAPIEEEPDLSADSDVSPVESIDLSQMEEEDLITLLAGTDDLSDIGALLSQNDNELPVEGEDVFAAFADGEMAIQADALEKGNVEEKKANDSKKGGFLQKLTTLLFGKDNEEEETVEKVSLSTGDAPGVIELSDENADILAAFAAVDSAETANKSDGKKAKKEKKKKEPKLKKAPKPKTPKKPKEKKPKEVDNTPPLPKGPVVLVCLLAVSIFVLVFFGPGLITYSSAMNKAEDLYKMGSYTEAAEVLMGLEINENDAMLYGKITTLAAVDSEISAYKVFMKNDRKAEALDSLVCAAGRCEINDDNSLFFDCAAELGILKDEIIVALKEEFGLEYEEAIEIYELNEIDRNEYTIALNEILEELGIITE